MLRSQCDLMICFPCWPYSSKEEWIDISKWRWNAKGDLPLKIIDRYLQQEIECQRRFAPKDCKSHSRTPSAKGDLSHKVDWKLPKAICPEPDTDFSENKLLKQVCTTKTTKIFNLVRPKIARENKKCLGICSKPDDGSTNWAVTKQEDYTTNGDLPWGIVQMMTQSKGHVNIIWTKDTCPSTSSLPLCVSVMWSELLHNMVDFAKGDLLRRTTSSERLILCR